MLRKPGPRACGKYSYAIYVLHFPPAVEDNSYRTSHVLCHSRSGDPLGHCFWPEGSGLIPDRYISWNVLERHCLALKKRFVAEPPAQPAVAGIGYVK